MLKSCSLHGSWACTVFNYLCAKRYVCFRFWKCADQLFSEQICQASPLRNMLHVSLSLFQPWHNGLFHTYGYTHSHLLSATSVSQNKSNSSWLNGWTVPAAECFTCLRQNWAEKVKEIDKSNQIMCGDMSFHSDWRLRNPWLTARSANPKVSGKNKRQRWKLPSLALYK